MDEVMPSVVPGLMFGAELADGVCSLSGMNFRTFMEFWQCPKTLMEVAVSLFFICLEYCL